MCCVKLADYKNMHSLLNSIYLVFLAPCLHILVKIMFMFSCLQVTTKLSEALPFFTLILWPMEFTCISPQDHK